MQARKIGVGPQQDQLKDCKTRIDAIAMIHEQLYQSRDYARVPFSEYVRNLVNNIVHAANVSADRIAVKMEIEQVALTVDKAIPCGLILNELMTNALKHAFPDGRVGTVRVELSVVEDGSVRLAVSDDGIGMPEHETAVMQTSIGMVLITTLTEQLQGRLTISRQNGTSLLVEFPTSPPMHQSKQ
jgi:two-component sensor histidine kinase